MKLAKVLRIDTRSSKGYEEAEELLNKHLIILQRAGCKIISAPRLSGQNYLVAIIFYDDPNMKAGELESNLEEESKPEADEEVFVEEQDKSKPELKPGESVEDESKDKA